MAPAYQVAFQEKEGFHHAVITGEQDSYDVTMGACTEIAAICTMKKTTRLLVEHKVKGRLSTLDIFKIASQLPDLFTGIHVAFVVHLTSTPDNPEFLQNVARNRGGRGRLFNDPLEAEAWLRSI